MILHCDKNMRSTPITCKKHLVVVERGIAKILYYRLYQEQVGPTYKQVSANDGIINALIKEQQDNKLLEDDFKDIIKNIKYTYKTLVKTNKQNKTLETLSEQYAANGLKTNLGYGILMEDDSIVFFSDFSDIISGRLSSIFRKGGLQ